MSVRQEKNKNKWTKDGRSWYYDIYYTDIYGNRKEKKSRYYKNKAMAKEAELDFLNGLKQNTSFDTNISGTDLLNEWLEFKSNEVKSTTYYKIELYVNKHILPMLANFKDIHNIKINHINEWKCQINAEKIGVNHKNTIIGYFQEILSYATINYEFDNKVANKLQKIKNEKRAQIKSEAEWNFWTPEIWNSFIQVVDDQFYRTLFIFMYFTGVRFCEMAGLTWKNVNLDKGYISIVQILTTKIKGKRFDITDPKTANSIRKIELTNDLIELLKKHKEKESLIYNFNDDMFVFGNIKYIAQTTFARKLDYYITKANVKRITPHGFRHSHVSLLIYLGCDSRDVANRVGDTVQIIESTYYHMFPQKKQKTIELLNKIK